MPTRPLGPNTIILRVPTLTVDSRDNTTYYTYANGATVTGCNFQPFLMTEKFQEEFTNERETTRTFYRVFVPRNAYTEAITDSYRILVDSIEYEVHALIGKWDHFSGAHNHLAFLVKRRTG